MTFKEFLKNSSSVPLVGRYQSKFGSVALKLPLFKNWLQNYWQWLGDLYSNKLLKAILWVFVFAAIVKLWGIQALLKLYSLIVSPVEFQEKYELVDKGEFNKLVTMNGHLSDLGLNSAEKVDEKLAELEKSKAENIALSDENQELKNQIKNISHSTFDKNSVYLVGVVAILFFGLFVYWGVSGATIVPATPEVISTPIVATPSVEVVGNQTTANATPSVTIPETKSPLENAIVPGSVVSFGNGLSESEQNSFVKAFAKTWHNGYGLFGPFNITETGTSDDIYVSRDILMPSTLIRKLLKTNPTWQLAIAQLNAAVKNLFNVSKFLRIEQSTNIRGIDHLNNALSLFLSSLSLENTGSPTSERHDRLSDDLEKWFEKFKFEENE